VIYIYSDGSCGRDSVGSWSASIHIDGDPAAVHMCGTLSPTCITRCELMPIVECLRWLRNVRYPEVEGKIEVRLVTDAELNAKRIMGVYKPHYKNKDLWEDIDRIRKYFDIDAVWRSRNTTQQLADCDKEAGRIRKAISKELQRCKPDSD